WFSHAHLVFTLEEVRMLRHGQTNRRSRHVRRSDSSSRLSSAVRAWSESLEARVLLSAASVTSYHNDLPSTGQNLNETVLTPVNVNQATFGKLYSTSVDGQVYAQPLYVPGVNITTGTSQGAHNVVFVATEHDTLYAMDGASGQILWKDSFLVPEAALTANGA